MKKVFFAAMVASASLFAQVSEKIEVPYIPFEIKMGKNFDAVQTHCLTCHSFGYILNQGAQSKKFWNEKVVKMIVHFKAPMTKEDEAVVTEYLFEHYGNGKLQ